jgi:Zn-finger nucleic acid-binding protein
VEGERRCPTCFVPLSEGGVGRCSQCAGQLLDHAHAADLLEGKLRLAPSEVRELSEMGGIGHRCPACRGEMKRFQLRGQWVDLCHGCGSMWMDEGEVARVLGEVVPRTSSGSLQVYADEVDPTSRFSVTSPLGIALGYSLFSGFAAWLAWWGLNLNVVSRPASVLFALLFGVGAVVEWRRLWTERLRIDRREKKLYYTDAGQTLELRLREIERVIVPRETTSIGFEVRLVVGGKRVVVGRHAQRRDAMSRAVRVAKAARLPMSAIQPE